MPSSPPTDSHTLAGDSPALERDKKRDGDIILPQGPPTVPSPPPDGGLRAWMNVGGAFLCLFCGFGLSNAFGHLENYYGTQQYRSQSPSKIAWVGSIQLWCLFSLSVISGQLYDRGYFRALPTGGSACYIFTFFMTSLCKEFWQTILAQGFGMGIGGHRIAVVGSSIGGVCFPIVLNNLLAQMELGPAYRIVGYLFLGLLVLANVMMSPRLKHVAGAPNPPHVSPITFFKEKRYVLIITGALFIALFGATNPGGAITFAILYGFFSGVYVSLVNPVFVIMANVPTAIGARFGVAFVLVGLAALIGTPVAGALLIRTPSFIASICFSAGVMVIGCALFVLARMEQARIKGTWKV